MTNLPLPTGENPKPAFVPGILYHRPAGKLVQQFAVIGGELVRLPDFVPGGVYKATGHPPLWVPWEGNWYKFSEGQRIDGDAPLFNATPMRRQNA